MEKMNNEDCDLIGERQRLREKEIIGKFNLLLLVGFISSWIISFNLVCFLKWLILSFPFISSPL